MFTSEVFLHKLISRCVLWFDDLYTYYSVVWKIRSFNGKWGEKEGSTYNYRAHRSFCFILFLILCVP